MSEEEKAIATLKEVASDDFDTLGDDISPKMAQSILNVISNQRKEINKAIEYIENAKKELYGCGNYYLSDLLNILKGELNGTKRGRKESNRTIKKQKY